MKLFQKSMLAIIATLMIFGSITYVHFSRVKTTHDKGKGQIRLITELESPQDTQIPIIYSGEHAMVKEIGLDVKKFDSQKLSYITIDGKQIIITLLEDGIITLYLQNDALKFGKHKLEITQYGNDKTDGEIITHKSVSYEIQPYPKVQIIAK